MATLFDGIPLGAVSTSMTINATAITLLALYVAVAKRQGVSPRALSGTVQNDILKEYVARGTWIFPVRPSMRLIADSVMYSNEQTPRFNPISIAGAHVRDAGCTAVEEMAYTLANAFAYVRPHDLEVERYTLGATGIVAELQRAIVVGPIARLELWPENPNQPDGHDPLIEAQMSAERFAAMGFKEGDKLVVSPRKARVFLQGSI
jgi:hypothetical protein